MIARVPKSWRKRIVTGVLTRANRFAIWAGADILQEQMEAVAQAEGGCIRCGAPKGYPHAQSCPMRQPRPKIVPIRHGKRR
jgi:hypothetical protein